MRLAAFLQRLKDEQTRLACEALETPNPGEFNHGRAVGMYAGLERAQTILLELVDEKDRKDFDL